MFLLRACLFCEKNYFVWISYTLFRFYFNTFDYGKAFEFIYRNLLILKLLKMGLHWNNLTISANTLVLVYFPQENWHSTVTRYLSWAGFTKNGSDFFGFFFFFSLLLIILILLDGCQLQKNFS